MSEQVQEVDFAVWNRCSSVVMFHVMNERARNFVESEFNLEGWQWMGDSFCVEPRFVDSVISSLEDEGFVVK